MHAYWSEGKDLGDDEVLLGLVAEAGVDRDEAAEVIAGRYADRIVASTQDANKLGINAIPAFVLDRRSLFSAPARRRCSSRQSRRYKPARRLGRLTGARGGGIPCARRRTAKGGVMEHHGSESYYILGEGLLGERRRARAPARRGRRGCHPAVSLHEARPEGPPLSDSLLERVADAMTSSGRRRESGIPAVYLFGSSSTTT